MNKVQKQSFKRAIAFTLILSIFCTWTHPLLAADGDGNPTQAAGQSLGQLPEGVIINEPLPESHPLAPFQNGAPNAVPAFYDAYNTASQYVIDYESNPAKSYSVHDPRLPAFNHFIANPSTEVIPAYNPNTNELHLEYYVYDHNTKNRRRVRSHVIPHVELEGVSYDLKESDGLVRKLPQLYRDTNYIMWTDKNGVQAIHTNFLKFLMGQKPVFVMNFLPNIAKVEDGSKFIGIEPFRITLEPRPIFDLTTGEPVKEVDGLRTLLFHVQKANGSVESYAVHYSVLADIFKTQLSALMALLYAVNPDPKVADEVVMILKEAKLAEKAQDDAAFAKLFEVMDGDTESRSLLVHVLKKVSEDPRVSELIRKYSEKPASGARSTIDDLRRDKSAVRVNVADSEAQNSWAKGYAEAMKNVPSSTKTWDEEVVSDMQKHVSDPNGVLENLEEVQSKIENLKETSRWNRIKAITQKALNHKAAKLVFNSKAMVIGGALTVEAINHFSGGALGASVASFITNAHASMLNVPLMDEATGVFAKSADIFKKPYAYVCMAAWFVVLNQLVPLSWAAGRFVAKAKGVAMDGVTSFFVHGARLFSTWNYPPQKLVWDYVLGQRQVYKALEAEMPLTSKGVLQNPLRPIWAFTKSILDSVHVAIFGGTTDGALTHYRDEKAKMDAEFEASLQSHMDKKSKALLLATALVSVQKGVDVDLVTLHSAFLREEAGVKVDDFLRNIETELPREAWKNLQLAAYQELKEIESKGVECIDLDTFVSSFEKLKKTSERIVSNLRIQDGLRKSGKPHYRAIVWIEDACQGAKGMFSKSLWLWIFFGHQGYNFHKKYKFIGADPGNVKLAEHGYRVDYPSSLVWTLIADAKNSVGLLRLFVGDISGGLSSMARQVALQIEQSTFYGLKGLIDYEMANPSNGRLQDPNAHPLDVLSKKYKGKTESFSRSLGIILRESVDPHSKRNIPSIFLNRMSVITEGVAANFWAGFLPKFILNPFVMGFSFAGGVGSYIMSSVAAAPQQMIALFNKLCIGYAAISGSVLVGYVAIWPFVVHWNNVIKEEAERNDKLLKSLSEKIWNAAQSGDNSESVRKEIEASLELFKGSKHDISFIETRVEHMGAEDMVKLAMALRVAPPIANKPSTLMIQTTNLVGSIVSSVLAVGLFDKLFGPDTNLLYLAIDTAMALTGTWLGAKYFIKPLTDYVLSFRKKAAPVDPDVPRYPTRQTDNALAIVHRGGCKAALGR